MNKYVAIVALAVTGAWLAGCTAPVVRDLPPVVEAEQPEPWPPTQEPTELPAPGPEVVQPAPVLPNPAVTSLINQSRAQYNSRNYQAAIATAERGLRIDRRTPELYLVLAQSYLQLGQTPQAEQFVQQGLRHAQPGSPVSEDLQRVRSILVGGEF